MPDGRGSMIPGAIAVPVDPGDAIVHARNVVHGSFPNKSDSTRCTLYFGFHPMASVAPYYDEETIRDQQRMLPLAVALRRCRKPDEEPFEYRGLGDDESFLDLCRQAQSWRSTCTCWTRGRTRSCRSETCEPRTLLLGE